MIHPRVHAELTLNSTTTLKSATTLSDSPNTTLKLLIWSIVQAIDRQLSSNMFTTWVT